jgi:hypothetical protein
VEGKPARGDRTGFGLRMHQPHRGGIGDRERNALRAEPASWRSGDIRVATRRSIDRLGKNAVPPSAMMTAQRNRCHFVGGARELVRRLLAGTWSMMPLELINCVRNTMPSLAFNCSWSTGILAT